MFRGTNFVARFLNRTSYEKSVTDSLYTFEQPENDDNSRKKLRREQSTGPNAGTSSKSINDLLSKASLIRTKVYNNYFKYYIARLFLCCKREHMIKLSQQEEGIRLARYRLDVRYITRKLQEFEKLKHLLLNDQ
mmetsp:Transcript_33009/g.29899  ORF Transcript_33009/g.29899 Transcript_33009/m.29899 type:complete len:134 (-) Transcript_33009:96-497(-)